MTSALIRKARHVLKDPALRRWLLRRITGLEKTHPPFTAGVPPYLTEALDTPSPGQAPGWNGTAPDRAYCRPGSAIEINLPGASVELKPENPGALFERTYADLETRLAAHRFAWLPLAGPEVDIDWVAALWNVWLEGFGSTAGDWPWHAYTAAERAINLIDFFNRAGLPEDRDATLRSLARHADVIRGNLEYFGEQYTSNHLSNNGRGLLRIGIALGLDQHTDTGAHILIAEAGRIFGRSGVLREGSTHYHVLVTRNYIDAWLAADAAGLEQASLLHDIAARAVAVIPQLKLPGGLPLIGDISPDAPPEYFTLLTSGTASDAAWPALLGPDARKAAEAFIGVAEPVSRNRIAEDGWHKFGSDGWHAMTFVSPDGWPPMPGHGHQDLGSFELHDGKTPIIVDPGRGSYDDAEYEGAGVHSGVTVGGHDPSPTNRPYYSDAFRARIVDTCPDMRRTRDGTILHYRGVSYRRGVNQIERQWRFLGNRVEITDRIEGKGTHRIRRQFFVDGAVDIQDGSAFIAIDGRTWKLSADAEPAVTTAMRWTEYGNGHPARLITLEHVSPLPWEGTSIVERY